MPRTFGRTKQGGERLAQEGQIAQGMKDGRCRAGEAAKQGGGIIRRAGLEERWFHVSCCGRCSFTHDPACSPVIFFCSALSRFFSRLSTFLMLSATGRFSGIVPPNS